MIVGRKEEIAELDKLYYSDRPEVAMDDLFKC